VACSNPTATTLASSFDTSVPVSDVVKAAAVAIG
jgi:hypothetical protein